jgi:hypothetical protein
MIPIILVGDVACLCRNEEMAGSHRLDEALVFVQMVEELDGLPLVRKCMQNIVVPVFRRGVDDLPAE